MVIEETSASFVDRALRLARLVRPQVGVQFLVYTPADIRALAARPFVGIEMLRKGRVVPLNPGVYRDGGPGSGRAEAAPARRVRTTRSTRNTDGEDAHSVRFVVATRLRTTARNRTPRLGSLDGVIGLPLTIWRR